MLIFCKRNESMIQFQRVLIFNNNYMSEIQQQNPSDVMNKVQNFNDLVKTISSDKRLDGADKQAIDELVELYQAEKASYIQETKTQVVQLLQESLGKGYTVRSEQDYWVLEKTLQLINPEYKIPQYQTIKAVADEYDTALFSVALTKDNNLEVYTRQSYMKNITSNTDLLGKFSLIDGAYTKKTFLDTFQFDDDLRNNNIVDMGDISASQANLIPTSETEIPQNPTEVPVSAQSPAPVPASAQTNPTDEKKTQATTSSAPVEKTQVNTSWTVPKIEKPTLTPEQAKLQEAIQYNRRYTSEQIKTIQQELWFTGEELDGKVWPKTVDAIRAFQALNNIVIDGKAWPETLDKMWYILKDGVLVEKKPEDTQKDKMNGDKSTGTIKEWDWTENTTPQEGVSEKISSDFLINGITIAEQAGYEKFKASSALGLPDWKDLPQEIQNKKPEEILSLALEDGKINVYFWPMRENESGQQYVMKYGELVNGKFEKASFFSSNFTWDDLWNNTKIN